MNRISGLFLADFSATRRRISCLRNHVTGSMTSSYSTPSAATSPPTVGIIVIGDEILKGQTQDTNSSFLAGRLFAIGVRVKKISVIPDDLDIIAREVADFSSQYTHVITSGGVGPTHDDITYEGVARAFNERVTPHPEIVALCKKFFGTDDLNSPTLKLALIPESGKLCYGVDKTTGRLGSYPIVRVKNVFVFPGVPKLLRTAFERLESMFHNPSVAFHTRTVYVSLDEIAITGVLNNANERFKDRVTMGSYPVLYHSYYKVKLSLESTNKLDVDEMHEYLVQNLPNDSVVDFELDPITHASDRVYALTEPATTNDPEFAAKVQTSLDIIEQCMSTYALEEVCVGFNGGKDCTALLHLFHAVVSRYNALSSNAKVISNGVAASPVNGTGYHIVQNGLDRDSSGRNQINKNVSMPASSSLNNVSEQISNGIASSSPQLTALYIRYGQPFPEMELFITACQNNYALNLISVTGPIKSALADLKHSHPKIKAVLMGTRCTDPRAADLQAFSPTDCGWPEYMRVNPLLHWTYADLWKFIRKLSLPYCPLYDRGYTSLGSLENTHPNPELRVVNERGVVSYRPAYTLKMSQNERAGRN